MTGTAFGAEGEAGYTSRYFFASLAAGYVIGENITTGNSLSSIPAQKLTATIGGRLPEWDFVAGFRLNVASDQNRTPPPILSGARQVPPAVTTGAGATPAPSPIPRPGRRN